MAGRRGHRVDEQALGALGDRDDLVLATQFLGQLLDDLVLELADVRVGHRNLTRCTDRVGDLVAAHAVAGDGVLGELEQVTVGVLQQLGELLGGDVPRLDERLAGRHALIGIRTDRRRFGERDTAPATLFDLVVCLLASKCHVIVVPVV